MMEEVAKQEQEEEEEEEGTTTTRIGENSELFRWIYITMRRGEWYEIWNFEQPNRFSKGRCEGSSAVDDVAEGLLNNGGSSEKKG